LTLYLDSSALVKRYVREIGSDAIVEAMERASAYKMCRVGFVETVRAVALGGGTDDVEKMEGDWTLAEDAGRLAVRHRLRTLDALHLAAALTLAGEDPTFATWDARLHRAARECGLRTLPVALD
jgi:predicted nucleic acid-binding protein